MGGAETNKKTLTIIAGILTILGVLLLAVFAFLLAAPYASWQLRGAVGALGVAIAGVVLAIVCKREAVKSFWVAFLVINLIVGFVDVAVVMPMYAMKTFGNAIASDAVERAKERTEISYVKRLIPNKDMSLHTAETKGSEYRYFDDDGTVAAKFKSMEFTVVCESSCYGMSETVIKLDEVTVTFASDYEGIVVRAMYGTFWGYGEAYKSYSVDPEEGKAFQALIEGKVATQKAAYEAAEAKAKAATTFGGALEAFQEGNHTYEIILMDKKYELGLMRKSDDEKKVLEALKALDESTFTLHDGNGLTKDDGFYYDAYPAPKHGYTFYYHAKEHVLRVRRIYDGPYGTKGSAYVYYLLQASDGGALMELARSIVDSQEATSA